MPSRWRAPAALLALALMFACLKGRGPTDAGASDVRFSLHTQVTSTAGSDLHVRVVYLDQPATGATTPVPVNLVDQRFPVTTGTTRLPLTVDLSRCLADPRRLVPGTLCQLIVSIALEQNGVAVDSTTLPPVAVVPGQVIDDTTSVSAVGQVKVVPAETSVAVGGTVQLSDTVFDINNVALPGHAVTWASAADTVATVNATGLVTGVRAGTTQITASAGGQVGTALLTVTPGATGGGGLTLQIGTVSFSAPAGGTLPANGFIGVTSSDTTTVGGLTATVTYGAGATGWLSANVSDSAFGSVATKPKPGLGMPGLAMSGLAMSGRRAATTRARGAVHALAGSNVTTPATLDVVPNTTGLAVGTYTATVTVSGSGGQTATLNVSYAISSGAVIAVTPNAVVDTAVQAGAAVTKKVVVTNIGTGSLSGLSTSVTYGAGATGWLGVAQSGTSAPDTLTLTATPGTNAPGTYSAQVTVASSVTGVPPVSFAVQLQLTPGTNLGLSPAAVTFNVYSFGGTPITSQTVTAINTGIGTLGTVSQADTISYAGNTGTFAIGWLGIGVSGTAITLSIPSTTLTLGTLTATVPFAATNALNNPQTLSVTTNVYVTFTKIAAGSEFACGLTTIGTVLCWGDNTYGQLGQQNLILPKLSVAIQTFLPVDFSNPVVDIETGGFHACALFQSGAVWCWGRNDHGQLGLGNTTSPNPAPTQIAGTWSAIALGMQHTCAIQSGTLPNYVDCWGDNSDGQLGLGGTVSTTPVTTPTQTTAGPLATIAAGAFHTCGVTSTTGGNIECWGDNTYGQLGNTTVGGNSTNPGIAILDPQGIPPKQVSAGTFNTCALDVAGNGYCWGDNTYGQLANGTTGTPVGQPVLLPVANFSSISNGYATVCGIAANGTYCWGNGSNGRLGNGTLGVNALAPTLVTGGTAGNFTQIVSSATGFYGCFISGVVVSCFGSDNAGQLGNNDNSGTSFATPVPMLGQPAPAGVTPSRTGPRITPRRTPVHAQARPQTPLVKRR